jgi:HEAT repeat protein
MAPTAWHRPLMACAGATLLALHLSVTAGMAQDRGPDTVSPKELAAAIDNLGTIDYAVRTQAAQTVRRAPAAMALPALVKAVSAHPDGYVRFRAQVLLAGYQDPRSAEVMLRSLADPNDRLREVAYSWFEAHPNPTVVPQLLARLDTELAEFVRPSLVRALAANAGDVRVQQVLVREALRGQDFFRSAVIEALGDYRATYAAETLMEIARLEGPLQNDAVLALGRIGDKRALEVFSSLQRSAPREAQPVVAASICLLGINCQTHRRYLVETLTFAVRHPGFQPLLRSAANGLGALAVRGDLAAFQALVETGIPSQDPARAAIALAVGRVALRNTAFFFEATPRMADLDGTIELLREAFDMLDEDLYEERFFVTARGTFWKSPEGSPERRLAERLIRRLEF